MDHSPALNLIGSLGCYQILNPPLLSHRVRGYSWTPSHLPGIKKSESLFFPAVLVPESRACHAQAPCHWATCPALSRWKSVKLWNPDPLGTILEHLLWAIRIHVFFLGGSPHFGWNKYFVLSLWCALPGLFRLLLMDLHGHRHLAITFIHMSSRCVPDSHWLLRKLLLNE